MKPVVNVLIASVGGQGGLTLARVLAEAAVAEGFSVRTGETLGMAQRYGSVVSFVRIGREVLSPTFSPGEADYVLGLELFETTRNIHYLSESGRLVVADEYRPPVHFSLTGYQTCRASLIERIQRVVPNAMVVPARRLAIEAGNERALNMVMLGVFNAIAELFPENLVIKAMRSVLSPKALEASVQAYRKGYEYARSCKNKPADMISRREQSTTNS